MLTVITGPMFSGKSSELISICKSNKIAGNETLVITPSSDTRYDINSIVTHDGIKFPAATLDSESPLDFCGAYKDWPGWGRRSLIAFDEVQFYNISLMEIINSLLCDDSIDILCAGLSQDSDGRPFGIMPRLLCIADHIISLSAVCAKCKKIGAATRTFHKGIKLNQVEVGGSDSYEARCFPCWNEAR